MSSGYVKAKHQAAGHDGNFTDEQQTLFFKPTNSVEVEFYQSLSQKSSRAEDNDDMDLNSWTPTFLGTLQLGVSENVTANASIQNTDFELPKIDATISNESPIPMNHNKPIIVLENLLQRFKSPNIMDVKLGKVLYDDSSSEDKKLRLQKVSTDTTSGTLGFRICGLKIQQNKRSIELDTDYCELDNEGYVGVNKFYGRSLTADNVKEAFELYFAHDALNQPRKDTLWDVFHKRLMLLYNTLLDEDVRLISSSLLFIYEGDPSSWDELDDHHELLTNDYEPEMSDSEDEGKNGNVLSSLSLIDFAHSKHVPGQGYDENVIMGVESLLGIFSATSS
ncbi:LAFA_0G08570g1_1 [Lachancea sp. 'fantastica']|nr:LAFA_0G08570g1_1 [Lachancea sp. 'fantastica']